MLYYLSKTKKVGSPVLTSSENKEVEYRKLRIKYAFSVAGAVGIRIFCRVMEVLYHRQIRSSAQRRNPG